MRNLRTHGSPPFTIAVIHGGPGAPGSLAPVARELAVTRGVLEPLQTADSLEGQVAELRAVLEDNAALPVTLIGASWGAWLGLIVAARYPFLARKLILVGSGPFEEGYAEGIMATRLARLGPEERREVQALLERLGGPVDPDRAGSLARLGELLSRTDAFDPLPKDDEPKLEMGNQDAVFQRVWKDASELRRSGGLLDLARQVRCPVVAIHGDYDPHPADGVREPLARCVHDYRFVLLEGCGHEPWRERQAREAFFEVVRREIA